MEETEANELQDLLGVELYNDLILYPTKSSNERLIDGLSWYYGPNLLKMNGLKYVLAYYFFANYIYESDLQDTFSGVVIHNFDESNDASKIRKDKFAKRARETASKYWQEVRLYLDNHTDDYPLWNCGSKQRVFKPKIRRLSDVNLNTDYGFKRTERVTTLTPPETVTPLENRGVESLTAGQTVITFETNLGSGDSYRLQYNAYDSSGVMVPVVIDAKEGSSFTVTVNVDCTLEWEATQL